MKSLSQTKEHILSNDEHFSRLHQSDALMRKRRGHGWSSVLSILSSVQVNDTTRVSSQRKGKTILKKYLLKDQNIYLLKEQSSLTLTDNSIITLLILLGEVVSPLWSVLVIVNLDWEGRGRFVQDSDGDHAEHKQFPHPNLLLVLGIEPVTVQSQPLSSNLNFSFTVSLSGYVILSLTRAFDH